MKEYHISLVTEGGGGPFQNNQKNLDLSYKMDLDFWDCLRREIPISWQNFKRLIQIHSVILNRHSSSV